MKKQLLFIILALGIITISCFEAQSASLLALAPLGFMKGFGKNLNIKDLRAFASKNFSSFEGENDNMFYTGMNDDFVDFGGENKSFVNSEKRVFTMTLANSVAYTRYAYIIPGLAFAPGRIGEITQDTGTKDITVHYPDGIVRDGNFDDKNGDSGLCGSGSPKTIETFFAFLAANPTHCHQIRIQANTSASQIAQNLTIQAQSPFKDLESLVLTPSNITDQNTYQDKVVVFPVDLVIGRDMRIEYPIVASDTVTITFFCDAIMNNNVTLKRKVNKARATALKIMGGDPITMTGLAPAPSPFKMIG